MDAKINNKDIATDNLGEYVMIDGFEEIVQRVIISLTVPKGRFVYHKDLGASYNGVMLSDIKQIEMIVNESLINIGDVYVKVNSASLNGNKIKLLITINYNNQTVDKEVII